MILIQPRAGGQERPIVVVRRASRSHREANRVGDKVATGYEHGEERTKGSSSRGKVREGRTSWGVRS